MQPPSPPPPPLPPLPRQFVPCARCPFTPTWVVHDLKVMDVQCSFCCALLWLDEHLSNSSKRNPRFGICCYQGKLKPPYLNPIPPELHQLLTHSDANHKAFAITFATIIKHWPLHLLEDMWMILLMMALAPTPLGFMASLSTKLAPFFPHQGNLLPGHGFISMTLLRL